MNKRIKTLFLLLPIFAAGLWGVRVMVTLIILWITIRMSR